MDDDRRRTRSCRRWSTTRRPAPPKCSTGSALRSAAAAARTSGSSICSSRSISRRSHPLALLSLADLYEQLKKPQLAIKVYERVPQNSPLRRNAEIQLAVNLDTHRARPTRPSSACNKLIDGPIRPIIEAIMALGNILRGRKEFAECAAGLQQGHRHHRQSGAAELADLLFPRHLQRARQALGEGRGRFEAGARSCIPTSRTC